MYDVFIAVVSHKNYNFLNENGYYPVIVGSAKKDSKDYLYDSELDNISNKNNYYAELTGIYWIWKNIQSEIKGIVHYRRYLKYNYISNIIISKDYIKKILNDYDLILPKKRFYPFSSVKTHYKNSHNISDITKIRSVILELNPEYIADFDKFFDGNELSLYNIMIAKNDVFDEYCSWLFPILLRFESKINLSSYKSYQARVIGFIGERLLNVWLARNNKKYKIKYLPIMNIEKVNYLVKIIDYIKKTYL